MAASIRNSIPRSIDLMPNGELFGGEMIFTSRPGALCHQLSNGAEVSIATPAARRGERSAQTEYVDRSLAQTPRIRRSAEGSGEDEIQPDDPHNYSARVNCRMRGVQKVSRPIDRCSATGAFARRLMRM